MTRMIMNCAALFSIAVVAACGEDVPLGGGDAAIDAESEVDVDAPTEPVFVVDVRRAGGGTGRVHSTPPGIDCGVDCTHSWPLTGASIALQAAQDPGSTFLEWSGGCTGRSICLVNETTTVTATFLLNGITVMKDGTGSGRVVTSPAGIDCGLDCEGTWPDGTSVTMIAHADPGSVFEGWSNCGSAGTGPCTFVIAGLSGTTATFTQLTHKLTAVRVGNGTVTSAPTGISCGADCSEVYPVNTNVVLAAAAGAGSTFTGWSGDCVGTGICAVTMTSAKTVTANFAP